MWSWLTGLTSDNWQAIGSIGTLAVAIVAALFARNQVREARAIRLEQSQPQVVVDFEYATGAGFLIELVIKNTGPTTARDVAVQFNPQLQSTLIEDGTTKMLESKILTDGIKTLPPGKTYRMIFEHSDVRFKRDDLSRSYEAKVVFEDSSGRSYAETYTLDLNLIYGYNTLVVYGVHDGAKALREITKLLSKWSEFSGGLKVFNRDGDKKDRAQTEHFKRMQEQHRRDRFRESRKRP